MQRNKALIRGVLTMLIILGCCVYIIYFHMCELENIFEEAHKTKIPILYWICLILIFTILAFVHYKHF